MADPELFPGWLRDEAVYARVERYWAALWLAVPAAARHAGGWMAPWFAPLPPVLSQGNPIFSAVSIRLGRGLRVIQRERVTEDEDWFAYLDWFGGSDPIRELVLSLVLTEATARRAVDLIGRWVAGAAIDDKLAEG